MSAGSKGKRWKWSPEAREAVRLRLRLRIWARQYWPELLGRLA